MSPVVKCNDCLICMALFPENCPPPLTPHNRILCWRERIIFVTVELLERKFNFLPIITQYKCYPWSVSQGTFYQIMAIPEKHTSPVTARGNIIHNWEINRIQQIQNLISYNINYTLFLIICLHCCYCCACFTSRLIELISQLRILIVLMLSARDENRVPALWLLF